MTAVAALNAGARQVLRFPKLIALFYAINLALAMLVVAPIALLINQRLGHSLENDREFLNFDAFWVMESQYQFHSWPLNSVAITLACAAILHVLLNTFLAGGSLAVFH